MSASPTVPRAQTAEVAVAVHGENRAPRAAHHLDAFIPGEVNALALMPPHLAASDRVNAGPRMWPKRPYEMAATTAAGGSSRVPMRSAACLVSVLPSRW